MNYGKWHLALLVLATLFIALAIGGLALAAEQPEVVELTGVQAVAVSPLNSQVRYVVVERSEPLGYSLFWTRDGGRSWQLLSADLPGKVTAIAVAAMDRDTIYLGTESMGVLKSTDGGHTWQAVNDGLGPMPNATVTSLIVAPDNPQKLVATIGYWLGTQEAHFAPMGTWVSFDGGMTWQQVGSAS